MHVETKVWFWIAVVAATAFAVASIVLVLVLGPCAERQTTQATKPKPVDCDKCFVSVDPRDTTTERHHESPRRRKEIWFNTDGDVYKVDTRTAAPHRTRACFVVAADDCSHDINLCSIAVGTKVCHDVELDDCKHDISLCREGQRR